ALFPGAVERCIAVAAAGVGPDQDEAEGGDAAAEMNTMLTRHEGAPWDPEAKAVWDSWTERVLATDDPEEVDRMISAVLPLYTAHPDRPDVAQALERFADDMKSDLVATKAWENGIYQTLDIR